MHRHTPHAAAASAILQEVLPDADDELRGYLSYPLEETLASDAAKDVVDDNFGEVAQAAVQAYESGALQEALQDGPDGFKVTAARLQSVWLYLVHEPREASFNFTVSSACSGWWFKSRRAV